VRTDFDANRLTIRAGEDELVVPFAISDFDRALVQAGGWVDYADAHY